MQLMQWHTKKHWKFLAYELLLHGCLAWSKGEKNWFIMLLCRGSTAFLLNTDNFPLLCGVIANSCSNHPRPVRPSIWTSWILIVGHPALPQSHVNLNLNQCFTNALWSSRYLHRWNSYSIVLQLFYVIPFLHPHEFDQNACRKPGVSTTLQKVAIFQPSKMLPFCLLFFKNVDRHQNSSHSFFTTLKMH